MRESGKVRLLDFTSGQERRRIAVADAELDTRYDRLALSADGALLALAGNGFIMAWDTATGQERFRRIGNFWATAVTISPGSAVLTWGCMYDPAIHRWDLQKGEAASPGHENWVQSVALRGQPDTGVGELRPHGPLLGPEAGQGAGQAGAADWRVTLAVAASYRCPRAGSRRDGPSTCSRSSACDCCWDG